MSIYVHCSVVAESHLFHGALSRYINVLPCMCLYAVRGIVANVWHISTVWVCERKKNSYSSESPESLLKRSMTKFDDVFNVHVKGC